MLGNFVKRRCHLIERGNVQVLIFLWPNILGIYNGCAIKILRQAPLGMHHLMKKNVISSRRKKGKGCGDRHVSGLVHTCLQ